MPTGYKPKGASYVILKLPVETARLLRHTHAALSQYWPEDARGPLALSRLLIAAVDDALTRSRWHHDVPQARHVRTLPHRDKIAVTFTDDYRDRLDALARSLHDGHTSRTMVIDTALRDTLTRLQADLAAADTDTAAARRIQRFLASVEPDHRYWHLPGNALGAA